MFVNISLSVDKTIAKALVSSRLDYCNSLLYNTANKDLAKLHRVQNYLARVVKVNFKDLYNNPLINTTNISKSDTRSSKDSQIDTVNE